MIKPLDSKIRTSQLHSSNIPISYSVRLACDDWFKTVENMVRAHLWNGNSGQKERNASRTLLQPPNSVIEPYFCKHIQSNI